MHLLQVFLLLVMLLFFFFVFVTSSGMSFPDLMVRQGVIDHPPKTPIIMGFECAGVIEGLGANVSGFNVSNMLWFLCRIADVRNDQIYFFEAFHK